MFEFFDLIAGWLETLGAFLISLFENLLLLISLLGSMSNFTLVLSTFLPPFLGTAVLATLLIFVLKFFLGR